MADLQPLDVVITNYSSGSLTEGKGALTHAYVIVMKIKLSH